MFPKFNFKFPILLSISIVRERKKNFKITISILSGILDITFSLNNIKTHTEVNYKGV